MGRANWIANLCFGKNINGKRPKKIKIRAKNIFFKLSIFFSLLYGLLIKRDAVV